MSFQAISTACGTFRDSESPPRAIPARGKDAGSSSIPFLS